MESERQYVASSELESITTTFKLDDRASRTPDLQQENQAFHELATFFALDPEHFLDRLVEVAARLCNADSVGISVEETDAHGEKIFRWIAIAGALKNMVGGTTPRNFSPCGVCVDANQPLLMENLDKAYPYFKEAPLQFVEALLLPWGGPGGGPVGTLWLVAHDDRRKFDSHDVRLMTSFAAFAYGAACLREKLQISERIAASLKVKASLSHHLNNPLQAAFFATFLLKSQTALDSDALELVSVLESEIHRVAALSSTFLYAKDYSDISRFPEAQFVVVLKGKAKASGA